MKLEITKEQQQALIGLVQNAQFKGSDAQFILDLLKALNPIDGKGQE